MRLLGASVDILSKCTISRGFLKEITGSSGPGGYATVQSIHYQYDKLGNVTARTDNIQNRTERFTYDSLNRLTQSRLTAHGATSTDLTVTYNAIGNIKTQSGVGTYTYSTHHPHAVKSISGKTDTAYTYDADGNTLTGRGKSYSWTAFNKPWRIDSDSAESQFWYAPDRARYKHVATANGITTTTRYIGRLMRVITPQGGATLYRHNIIAAGRTIAIYTNTRSGSERIRYLHHNAQGSVTAVTDGMGKIVTRMSYTAFGERRDPITGQGAPKPPNTIATDRAQTYRGYTGQEELDAVGLIHYNGRVYDPRIGRFISADPFVQAPYNIQSLNRYSYAWNNPATFADPSGFVTDAWSCTANPFGGGYTCTNVGWLSGAGDGPATSSAGQASRRGAVPTGGSGGGPRKHTTSAGTSSGYNSRSKKWSICTPPSCVFDGIDTISIFGSTSDAVPTPFESWMRGALLSLNGRRENGKRTHGPHWLRRGTFVGYGKSRKIRTGGGRVKVVGFDASGSPHHLSFKYTFKVRPADYDGIWGSFIYSGTVDTGLYILGTTAIYPSPANRFSHWIWIFTIPQQPRTCGNCGKPGLRIYEEVP